jgi:hypothetical protein
MAVVIFPNAQFPSTVNAQTNAQAFADALWDFLRTLQRAQEDATLPSDNINDLVDIGMPPHVSHAQIGAPTKWQDLYKHPTLNQWAIKVRPLFILLVDINNANSTIADRATRIRNAINNGATLTRPSDGLVIANSFWQVDAATTATRWNRLAQAMSTAVAQFPDGWVV